MWAKGGVPLRKTCFPAIKTSSNRCVGIDNVHTKRYIYTVIFDWDSNKNSENTEKHEVSFEQAQEFFFDPLHLSILDERFSYLEERWITMGATENGEVLGKNTDHFSKTCNSPRRETI